MGHRLDREVERNFRDAKALGLEKFDITHYIEDHMEMKNVLQTTMQYFDGWLCDMWYYRFWGNVCYA